MMCGIAAFFAMNHGRMDEARATLHRVDEAMADRGPDGHGLWVAENGVVGLAHRRLAIIDPGPSAAQPMRDELSGNRITFNGEIYNFLSLRLEMEDQGIRFCTRSDTEVLLKLYSLYGEGMLGRLRGMFAFVIWDEKRGRLFGARDPYGIKPLYWANDGKVMWFASQVRALKKAGIGGDPAAVGAYGFLLWGSIPEPFTFYEGIEAIPAGHCFVVDRGDSRPQVRSYASLPQILSCSDPSDSSDAAIGSLIRSAVQESVESHLVADVPVGLFLSAGLDSSVVAACLPQKVRAQTRTITLAFEGYRGTDDETLLSSRLAARLGLSHQIIEVGQSELGRETGRFFGAMDQPSVDGLNMFLVSAAAHRLGIKACLSGVGADELFGGYATFDRVRLAVTWTRFIQSFVGKKRGSRIIACIVARLFPNKRNRRHLESRLNSTVTGAYELSRLIFAPDEIEELAGKGFWDGVDKDIFVQTLEWCVTPMPQGSGAATVCLESQMYLKNQLLRDADWAGMANAVEVRTPFVDIRLFERVAPRLWSGSQHHRKMELFRPAFGDTLLPEYFKRKKTGFAVPSIARMLEETPELGGWKKHPFLQRPDCHWSRRWCYTVWERFGQS